MAMNWARPCRWRGCPEVVRGEQTLCEIHRKQIQKERTRTSRSAHPEEQRFYNSNEWTALTRALRAREPLCRECLKRGRETFGEVSDHVIPLRMSWELRLSPVNIQTLCHSCHNKKRAIEAKIYRSMKAQSPLVIVYGPPGAGKTTFARENMRRGEVIVDFDLIFSALTGLPVHDKPESLVSVMLDIRHAIIAQLALLGPDRPRTWVVGTFPLRSDRDRFRKMFSRVEVILINASVGVCVERVKANPQRAGAVPYFTKVIKDWHEEHEPELEPGEKEEFSI